MKKFLIPIFVLCGVVFAQTDPNASHGIWGKQYVRMQLQGKINEDSSAAVVEIEQQITLLNGVNPTLATQMRDRWATFADITDADTVDPTEAEVLNDVMNAIAQELPGDRKLDADALASFRASVIAWYGTLTADDIPGS